MIRIPVREPELDRPTRWSSPPGGHFLTLCSTRRHPGLATPHFNSEFHAAMHMLVLEHQWQVRTAVVMPHHVHLLVHVDEDIELAAVVRTFKDQLAPCLEPAGLSWMPGHFDRRINPGEDPFPVFLYIFLNPYEARLIPPQESWSGYYCAEGDWSWFSRLRRTACQYPPWLPSWRLYAVTPAQAELSRSA